MAVYITAQQSRYCNDFAVHIGWKMERLVLADDSVDGGQSLSVGAGASERAEQHARRSDSGRKRGYERYFCGGPECGDDHCGAVADYGNLSFLAKNFVKGIMIGAIKS